MSRRIASSAGLRVHGVALVALTEVRGERLGADTRTLRPTPARALGLVGDEEHLQLGRRRDDAPDVAPFDDAVAELRERALALAHHLAYLGVASDRGDEAVDLGVADRGGDVLTVDPDEAVRVERHRVLARERGERGSVVQSDTVARCQPRERAVHRTGVEMAKAEAPGEERRDRALSGPGRPVDGDDHAAGG